jgi:hypothetical protein
VVKSAWDFTCSFNWSKLEQKTLNCLETLKLLLFERPLHPELFDIHDEIKIGKPSWDAQIWITGGAHVVTFSSSNHTLTEVLADDEVPLPRRGLLLSIPFVGEKSHERRCNGGINYMMNFQVETMSARVYLKTHRDLVGKGKTHGTLVTYPQWTINKGQNSMTPFSYITCDSRPNGLHIMTFHAYPDETTIIKTQSIFELG